MVRVGILFAVGFVLLAFAGCSGGKAGPASSSPGAATVSPGSEGIPDAGTVVGTVVDDALAPIRGAQAALVDLSVSTTTGDDGSFRFANVPPGSHRLAAVALGYESIVSPVEVAASAETTKTMTLARIEIDEVGYTVFGPLQGYFECREADPASGTGPCPVVPTTNDKSSLQFSQKNNTKAIVGEMRWSQGSFATSQRLRLSFSYIGRPSTHWWCTATSGSPITWTYLVDDNGDGSCQAPVYCGIASSQGLTGDYSVPKPKHKLQAYTNTPFACTQTTGPQPVELALQQHFEILVTTFQSSVPPQGYSGFKDA